MKVSMSKFYKEVTGRTTANRATTGAALERWGVPFDSANGIKGDVVDVAHLEAARIKWTEESAARVARNAKATPDPEGLALLVRIDDNLAILIAKFDDLLVALQEASK